MTDFCCVRPVFEAWLMQAFANAGIDTTGKLLR